MEDYHNNQKKRETIEKRRQIDEGKFLEELKKTPILAVAAKRAGLSRATVYRWKSASPDFVEAIRAAMHEGNELVSDMAESQIIKKIQEGSFPASKYWLENHKETYKKVSQWGRKGNEDKGPRGIAEIVEELEQNDENR